MNPRLYRVGGERLVKLRFSDAPKVARAILDAMCGDARVLLGETHGSPYIQFVREGSYNVTIRGEDWAKIFPFVRYSTSTYTPVVPPGNPPAKVSSPQPNRLRVAPPEKPDGGLRSFLDKFPYDEYREIQILLSELSLSAVGGLEETPPSLDPLPWDLDGNLKGRVLYDKLVTVLQRLFPEDFPIE